MAAGHLVAWLPPTHAALIAYLPFLMYATTELVVPKSMPTTSSAGAGCEAAEDASAGETAAAVCGGAPRGDDADAEKQQGRLLLPSRD